MVGDSFACKYYVVVVYLTSLLLITYILTSVAPASTAAALKVTADRNILVPVVPEGKQWTHTSSSFMSSRVTDALISAATNSNVLPYMIIFLNVFRLP